MPEPLVVGDSWLSRVRRDLRSLGDPVALVEATEAGGEVRVKWTSGGGESRETDFRVCPRRGLLVKENGCVRSYEAFLAGEGMADLRSVAGRIRRLPGLPGFVDTRAEVGDSPASEPRSAAGLVTDLLEKPSGGATQLVLLTGDSGSGKTSVLRSLVERCAERYLLGETERLLLPVNARGRSLGRLRDAFVVALRDLQVSLPYHSLAVLTRRGLLVPVIAGFDELLGMNDYDDGFTSLADFLDELEGEGRVVLSARTTGSEALFAARIGELSQRDAARWTLAPVRIREWADDERARFLDRRSESGALPADRREVVERRLSRVFSGRRAVLAAKPLFFTRVADLLRERPDFDGREDLLESLVNEVLERESQEKLLDRNAYPILRKDQLGYLLRELAQEMWNQETRELDARSVREVVEEVAETLDLPEAARPIPEERLRSLALLTGLDGNGSGPRLAFEHELFFFYFLAESIVGRFRASDSELGVILSRSPMPRESAGRIAGGLLRGTVPGVGPGVGSRDGKEVGAEVGEDLQTLLDRLYRAGRTHWLRTHQVRENAGALAAALFRRSAGPDAGERGGRRISGARVRGLVLPGGELGGVVFDRCRFEEVTLRRMDLTRTRFLRCAATDLVLEEPVVDPGFTRLEIGGLELRQVRGVSVAGSAGPTYDPVAAGRTLQRCGAPIPLLPPREPPVDPEVAAWMEAFLGAYRRANPVCVRDDSLRDLFGNPRWPEVRERLLVHGIVSSESRSTGGRKEEFLRRRFRPDQVMAGLGDGMVEVEPPVRAFWDSFRNPA